MKMIKAGQFTLAAFNSIEAAQAFVAALIIPGLYKAITYKGRPCAASNDAISILGLS